MDSPALLDLMMRDLAEADALYRPTNFWQSATPAIIDDLNRRGFAKFRDHPSAAIFYVPTYRAAVWSRHRRLVTFAIKVANRLLLDPRHRGRLFGAFDGRNDAAFDYRLFKAVKSNGAVNLRGISESESEIGGGERITFEGQSYSRSLLNYLRGLGLLNRVADGPISSVLEIGGGYGTLGEIICKASESSIYVNVDIPPLAAVSTYYLRQLLGNDAVLGYDHSRDMDNIDLDGIRQNYRCAVLCPWQLPRLRGSFDLFANFMSFQEIEPASVRNYVALVQPLISSYVLMRNRQDGMHLASSEVAARVIEPVTTAEMVEMFTEFELVERDWPIHGHQGGGYVAEAVCLKRKS